MNKGQLIVVSGPSGSGKDTIIAAAIEKLGKDAFLSVSMTTRAVRGEEKDGVDYYFVSTEEFERHIRQGDMLEYAKYGSNYYGTSAEPIRRHINEGHVVFFNIEVQGGASVKKVMPEAVKVFITPPSLQVLEERLRGRGTEDESAVMKRLSIAQSEVQRANEYDYVIVNDDLAQAVDDLISIVKAESLKIDKMNDTLREVWNNV